MGLDPSLDEAIKMAVREAIDFLVAEKHLTREDAYMLCSVGVDFNVNPSRSTAPKESTHDPEEPLQVTKSATNIVPASAVSTGIPSTAVVNNHCGPARQSPPAPDTSPEAIPAPTHSASTAPSAIRNLLRDPVRHVRRIVVRDCNRFAVRRPRIPSGSAGQTLRPRDQPHRLKRPVRHNSDTP